MKILLILTLISFSIFLISYNLDKRKLYNGFLFNISLFMFLLTATYITFSTSNILLMVIFFIFFIIAIFILIFGIYILIIGLFINARIVIKRESRSLSNLLTFFLGLVLLFHVILTIINPERFLPSDINAFIGGFILIEIYFLFSVFNFLMISLLYQLNRPKLNQDFIIVLGSRVIGDKVPPLLASRIKKAIEFYNKQAKASKPPKIIFSGGQGKDEKVSEAFAMQKYAIENGIPISDTILEDKSTTTFENMSFSKNIMDKIKPSGYNSIFVTNNYHLFRAGLYAKKANLKSDGIGAKTALYFIPNALIREYIAIVVMNKKRHFIVISFILICSFILALINYFLIG
ncbi:YdcF family protein [Romboutsia sp. 1001285H_161024_C4]|uniref:YdcF family protein n=1 Tax=Romboutsia sp. 1001285H_161024_C4 TaxID=2787109 RepID=UPI001899D260|nr:YdcF family protein [Romboutsia sp. 1001285H_161024_C4]